MNYKKLPVIPDKYHLRKRLSYLRSRNPEVTEELSLDSCSTCPFCGKQVVVATRNMAEGRENEKLTNQHFARSHLFELLEIYEKAEASKPSTEIGDPCPICSETWISMKSHVERDHHLKWDEFVRTTGYTGGKVKETDSHKNRVSSSRLAFYQTEKGQEYKKIYRKVGDENPARRPEVRKKISKAALGRPCPENAKIKNSIRKSEQIVNSKFTEFSSGYGFHLLAYDKEFYSRSFTELRVLLSLLEIEKIPDVEPCRVPYIINGLRRNYVPDFKVDDVFYEVKVSEEDFKTEKYEAILSTGLNLKFLNNSTFYETFGAYPLDTYSVYQRMREYLEKGFMKITLPSRHHGEYSLLLKVLGEDYLNILRKAEEAYYENKESICRS